jgi:Fic family protein
LLLCTNGVLDEPILYLSLYLKTNRNTYYELLQEVRSAGTWETWLEFFLNGIYISAKQAIKTAEEINNLFYQDMEKIAKLGRARFSCEKTFEYIKRLPQVTAPLLSKELQMTAPTARSALNHMTSIGILEEVSGKKRDKVYVYRKYLEILEDSIITT